MKSNAVTILAIAYFISIYANTLPTQLNGPMLNAMKALGLWTAGGEVHRDGFQVVGSEKFVGSAAKKDQHSQHRRKSLSKNMIHTHLNAPSGTAD